MIKRKTHSYQEHQNGLPETSKYQNCRDSILVHTHLAKLTIIAMNLKDQLFLNIFHLLAQQSRLQVYARLFQVFHPTQ